MRRVLGVMLLLLAGFGVWALLLSRHPHPPLFPHFRRQVLDKLYSAAVYGTRSVPDGWKLMVPPPPLPKLEVPPSVAAYKSAIAANKDHPGALSFHADSNLYCEYNRKQVEEQARKEGITVEEVKELTFFGQAAMRTTQPSKVAEVLGRNLSADETRKLDQILSQENQAFQAALHQEVDEGVSVEQRWETIRSFEQHYMDQFAQNFGMTDAQFDQMLQPDPDTRGARPTIPAPANIPLPPAAPSPEPASPPAPGTPAKPVVPTMRPTPPSSSTPAQPVGVPAQPPGKP